MIEGIPDGWELVRIGKPFINERYIGLTGAIVNCVCIPSGESYAIVRKIIRKIEKPKRYRPFANAAEAEPFFDRRLRYKADKDGSAIMRITVLGRNGIEIARDRHTYKEAFDRFVLTDGTPFGIEVTE